MTHQTCPMADSYKSFDPDLSPDEQEEKARLISQVLELQNTLDGKLTASLRYLARSIAQHRH
ncbi:hypothetical protein FJT64_015486 [Amphibalanus amphitrite]|uniref:Uncharacterized protein n=1 Tax=Amphibalanus amphitrite TaxID=1232801 RepID=A0A6A4X448_AMPAM|nr:hypothetical protein FJT64_015486 [Amphibalanus amphitrite]